MPEDDVGLVIGGQEYGGWTAASVTRSLEAGAGSFALDLTDRWPEQPQRQGIVVGDSCQVKVAGQVMISGWIDEVQAELDASSHRLAVRGRDAVGDLIDCAPDVDASADRAPGAMPAEWTNIGLLEVLRALAEPFGITVRSEVAYLGPAFQKVALNPGQRAFEVIEELCRYRQVLPISDGLGGLVLVQAGQLRVNASVVEGRNLLSGSATYSNQNRFSEIIIKGQDGTGDFGPTASLASGRARDSRIKRHRPLLLQSEQTVDDARCDARAVWEALTRAARASQARLRVQGWRTRTGGPLWPLNAVIVVLSPTLGLRGEFLISEVSYDLSESGTTTSLVVTRPDAFQPPPEQEVRVEKHGFGDLRSLERQRTASFGDLRERGD